MVSAKTKDCIKHTSPRKIINRFLKPAKSGNKKALGKFLKSALFVLIEKIISIPF